MRSRNPLDLVHRMGSAPLLAEKAKPEPERPLSPLLRAARENELVVWHRVRACAQVLLCRCCLPACAPSAPPISCAWSRRQARIL